MNGATPSSLPTPDRDLTSDERVYLLARLAVLGAFALLFALGVIPTQDVTGRSLYFAAFGLLAFGTVVLFYTISSTHVRFDHALALIAAPDLVAAAIFTYLSGATDGFYAVMIVAPVLLALIVSRRGAWRAGALLAAVYFAAHMIMPLMDSTDYVLLVMKSLAIVLVAVLVANSVEYRREREEEAEGVATETEHLNDALRRRVSELQAVSDITELVHSSLDFESVGPQMLEIVAQAVGVGDCCLFIIDKERSETLFSASKGASATLSTPLTPGVAQMGESHLTCIPVFDRGSTMVLFCANANAILALTEDDRLVLSAVANELVVAAENSRLYRLTSHLAVTDELTGLSNYRQLQRSLDEELVRARRYKKHLALVMIDADDFKSFNDAQGHLAGDQALADLGRILRSVVREVDLVARYGGEEFAVVLPETDVAGAFVAAEKIREAVELHEFADAANRRSCHITVSLGVATFPTHGLDKESLLREADGALYHAKNGGKNRVRASGRRAVSEPTGEIAGGQDESTGA